MRRACSSLEASTSSAVERHAAIVVSGSSSATCRRVRSAVRGVRSSWEALATKCRCASNAASRRPNRSSRVSPSSLSSSSGPSRARRSCRLVEEILRAVRVMVRMGRSILPATSQPAQEGEHGHDGQGDSRVDQKLVRVGGALCGLDGPAWAS